MEEKDCNVSESEQHCATMDEQPRTCSSVATQSSVEASVEKIIQFPSGEDKEPLATEAGHWYLPDGTPFYTVPRRSGKLKGQPRPVSLRHDRKLMLELGVAPSTTTITGIIDKPGLNLYHERNIFNATIDWVENSQWEDSSLSEEARDKLFPEIREKSKEHSRAAAERGTALHAEIERFLRGDLIEDKSWLPHLTKLVATLSQYGINIREGAAEKSFWHRAGYGGKTDWHSRELPMLLDFKSKPNREKFKETSGYAMQLASYREGLLIHGARCANVFVGCDDCEIQIFEWPESDLRKAWQQFLLLLKFWKLENNYYPKAPKGQNNG